MARGHDGQYVISFSSIGSAIPPGNPYEPSYPPTHDRADFTLTSGRPHNLNPQFQRQAGTSIINNGVRDNYPTSYQTYSARTAYSGEHYPAPQNNNFQSLGRQPQGHQSQGHQPQGHQPQGHQLQGHQPQGHQPQGYQLQGHQSQGHQLQSLQLQGQQPVHVAQTIGPGSTGQYHTLPAHNSPSGYIGSVDHVDHNQNDVKSHYASPTHYSSASDDATQAPISFQRAYDTHDDQSFKTLTLFRTTIPESPSYASEHTTMDTSSSVKESAAAPIEASPVPVQPEQPIEEMSSIMEEEFDNYETVVITSNHVVSADVHEERSVEVAKQPEAQTNDISPELSIEKAIELESVYAKPKSLAERQSAVPVMEVLQTAGTTDDHVEEVYSQVSKPQSEVARSPPGSDTAAADEDEEPHSPPPIPLKTDESYVMTEGTAPGAHSESQRLSAMEDIHRRAIARQEEQDYYSTVEATPGAAMVLTDDLDDYATVNHTPNLHLRDRSPDSSVQSYDTGTHAPARVAIDNDEDDYATVEIASDSMPGPSTTHNNQMPNLAGLNIAANSQTGSGDILPGTEATDRVEVKPKLPLKPSKSIDFQLPKVYKIGQTFNVYLHEHDITKLRVDAIVNAANSKLKHGSGVAASIVKAGGKDFEKDCKKLMKKVRQIPVSHVEVTGPGKLPCKKVIHAVGPNWNDYKDKTQIPVLLDQTFANIFKRCSKEGVTSVGIPPVSSGQFCVPNDKVAVSLHQSILDLIDTLSEQRPPAHIHIVDIKPNFLQSMIEQMNGAVVTTRGSTVVVEELSQAEVERDLAGILLSNGAESHKKSSKMSSKSKEHSVELDSSGYIDKFGRKQVTRL